MFTNKNIFLLLKNICVIIVLFHSNLFSQNLVINPSFESFTNCPNGPGNFNTYVQTWVNAYNTNACSSPDYYNGCNTNTFAGVPVNTLGNQNAATGVAYAGIMLFEASFQTPCLQPNGKNYREYIMGNLSSPLVAGQNYSVSFSINLPEDVMYSTADIGVYLSAANPISNCPPPNPPNIPSTVLSYIPQLNYTGIPIANTTGWTQLQWTYTATGGEQYFIIGNFKDDANTVGICTNPSAPMAFAYYYIDDVSIDTVAISTPLSITTTSTNILCNNLCTGTATVAPTGTAPFTYSWNSTPVQTTQTATGLCAGNYTITVTDANNNTATSVVTITQPPAISINTSSTASLCANNNGTASATVNGGTPTYTYLWNPGGSTNANISNLAPGTYTVTITDNNGCTQTATTTVMQSSGTLFAITNSTNASCLNNDGSATVTASGGTPAYSYLWSPTGGTNTTATNLTAGIYTVTVTDINGCTYTSTVTINAAAGPTAFVSPNISIQAGTSVGLAASGGVTYNWFPTTNLSCTNCNNPTATPNETTTYCVEVSDSNGCKDTACVTITIDIDCPDIKDFALPNAFSPNADGTNDEFCLLGWDDCIKDFTIIIYNRWGEKVFESKDPNFCWSGEHKNTIADAQAFTYYIKAKHIKTNEVFKKKGNITLVR